MNLLLQTAIELGLITSITALALYISYSMLNIADLSTDGTFTLGATISSVLVLSNHPYLAIIAAIIFGMISGLITAFLQTFLGINSLLAGIIVNTALFSINIFIMGNSSLLNLNQNETIFTIFKKLLANTFLANKQVLLIALLFVTIIIIFITYFLKTRLGLAIRATGDNIAMVKSSSINPNITIIVGLSIASGLTALSGCLLSQMQKSVNIDIGSGMVTIALASLLIGRVIHNKRSIMLNAIAVSLGSIVFRLIYTLALRFNMPAYMLKLVSAMIVAISISLPYLKEKMAFYKRKRLLVRGS